MATNALYFGMATDIMTPLLLIPDVDNIYVMNKVDKCYGGSINGIKREIKYTLLQGKKKLEDVFTENGEDAYENEYIVNDPEFYEEVKIDPTNLGSHSLPHGQCQLLYDYYDKETLRWELKFRYNNKVRKLIYYFDFDFCDSWPGEINTLQHLVFNGALSIDNLSEPKYELTVKMIEQRALQPTMYALAFNHPWFPVKYTLYNGLCVGGTSVSSIKIDDLKGKWWERKNNYMETHWYIVNRRGKYIEWDSTWDALSTVPSRPIEIK
jgi:hypothetical protein